MSVLSILIRFIEFLSSCEQDCLEVLISKGLLHFVESNLDTTDPETYTNLGWIVSNCIVELTKKTDNKYIQRLVHKVLHTETVFETNKEYRKMKSNLLYNTSIRYQYIKLVC